MTATPSAGTEPSLRRFQPYPQYQYFGVEWLRQIPAHWTIARLKAIASVSLSNVDKHTVDGQEAVRLCNYTDVYYNERITNDIEFMAATATSEQARRFELCCGDVLVTKDSESWTDIAVPSVVAEDLPGVLCGYHLALVRPSAGAIAAFLDRETAKIDALVAKKERLIELLQEKRTALITQAVTKGLDPNAPMKDSGVEWIGKIPEHWRLRKLKHVCERVFVGVAEAATFAYVDDGVPMLRSTDVRANRIRTDDIRRIDPHFADRLVSKQLRTSDIVTVRTGNAGVSAVVPSEYDGGQCFTLVVSRPGEGHDGRYFCYWLNAPAGQQQFAVEGMGTAQINISVPIVQNATVCVPPPEDQEQIADWLEKEVARWDALTMKIHDAIALLKEYRTALISAAVTGKIDVRNGIKENA